MSRTHLDPVVALLVNNIVGWRWVGDYLGCIWVIHFHAQGIILKQGHKSSHLISTYMTDDNYIVPGQYIDLPVEIPPWDVLTPGMLDMLAPLVIVWHLISNSG